jgi:hypothetical protein
MENAIGIAIAIDVVPETLCIREELAGQAGYQHATWSCLRAIEL